MLTSKVENESQAQGCSGVGSFSPRRRGLNQVLPTSCSLYSLYYKLCSTPCVVHRRLSKKHRLFSDVLGVEYVSRKQPHVFCVFPVRTNLLIIGLRIARVVFRMSFTFATGEYNFALIFHSFSSFTS